MRILLPLSASLSKAPLLVIRPLHLAFSIRTVGSSSAKRQCSSALAVWRVRELNSHEQYFPAASFIPIVHCVADDLNQRMFCSVMFSETCVPVPAAKKFVSECLVAAGTTEIHAQMVANTLVAADHRGHFSHGLNRLEKYIRDLQNGFVLRDSNPVIVKETPVTAMVDGMNSLGPVVGQFCIDLAIKKAKDCGVGWVVARGSNHYGIAGYYAMQAADQGLVGFSMTNASPHVLATRAKESTLGTNPIACAAPAKGNDSLVVDMATATVATGKIEMCRRKGIPIPDGWGADSNGKPTNVPSEILGGGGVLPLGGVEETGGYKGYGLSMMVETMCGIMAGATYGRNIKVWGRSDKVADLGQCFIVVDPSAFCDSFQDRMQDLIDTQRNLEPAKVGKKVLVPGDPERTHMKMCDENGGIPYLSNVVNHTVFIVECL